MRKHRFDTAPAGHACLNNTHRFGGGAPYVLDTRPPLWANEESGPTACI